MGTVDSIFQNSVEEKYIEFHLPKIKNNQPSKICYTERQLREKLRLHLRNEIDKYPDYFILDTDWKYMFPNE